MNSSKSLIKSLYRSKTPDFKVSRKSPVTMDKQPNKELEIENLAKHTKDTIKVITSIFESPDVDSEILSLSFNDIEQAEFIQTEKSIISLTKGRDENSSPFLCARIKTDRAKTQKVLVKENDYAKRLGPGFYNNTSQKSSAPGFQFSSTPRSFFPKREHMLNTIQSRFVSSDRKREADIKIKKTLDADLSRYSPQNKLEIIRKKAQENLIKEKLNKKTKENIFDSVKEFRERQLDEKFKKFELRLHKKEILSVKKNWILLNVVISVATSVNIKFKKKRIIKRKLAILTKRLFGFTRVLGRFLRILKKFRLKYTYRNLRINFVPVLRVWLENKRRQKANLILKVFDKVLTAKSIPIYYLR